MEEVLYFFADMFNQIWLTLSYLVLNIGSYTISWSWLLIGYSALCMVIAVFWRGVRK